MSTRPAQPTVLQPVFPLSGINYPDLIAINKNDPRSFSPVRTLLLKVWSPLIPKEGRQLIKSICSESTLLDARGFTGGMGHLWELLCSGRSCLLWCKQTIYECTDINGGGLMAFGGNRRKPLCPYISHTWWNTDKSWQRVSETVRPVEPQCQASREASIVSLALLSKSSQTEIRRLPFLIRLLEFTLKFIMVTRSTQWLKTYAKDSAAVP